VGVTRLDRPVISVGNLSSGGTGKTPLVRWVVSEIQAAGHRPVVAMRGYKARPGRPSDEEREHREAMPAVPVVADPRRAEALRSFFVTPEGATRDCVLLDDGFQHRRLARDLDIVLVDASRPPDRDRLLPAGHLREPPGSLSRADVVVLTHAELVRPEEARRVERAVREAAGRDLVVALAEHRWTGLLRSDTPGDAPADLSWLAGRRVVGACAIGHPEGFFAALDRAGARCVARVVRRDHDPFAPATVRRIAELADATRAEAVVVTAKDWVKLRRHAAMLPRPVIVPVLGLAFQRGACEVRDAVRSVLG
jgi:tetraacyldisaccharide 4'-kinase